MIEISINPIEEELRRLTVVQRLVRKEIDTTRDMKKKEVYRKKHEKISRELNCLLNQLKLSD